MDTRTLAHGGPAVSTLGLGCMGMSGSYGPAQGPFVRRHRDRVVLATKFGMLRNPDGTNAGLCGTPAYVRSACG